MKLFKQWDRRFTREELRNYRRNAPYFDQTQWLGIEEWPLAVLQHSQNEVQKAVYYSDDTEAWQRFRVSLKGLTTYMKLNALYRYRQLEASGSTTDPYRLTTIIRVDNYLGALVRGGQLDAQYRIKR